MAAGSIIVDLLMRTGSFETDTARSAKSLKKLQKDAEAVGRAIGLAFTGAVTGLAYLVKSSIDSADHLNDLSKRTGVAVEVLGGLGFAASQAGGDLESTATGLGKLNKSIAEAAAGNKEAAEGFKVLGISVRDSSGQIKNAGQVYLEVADKFEAMEDGPNKAALALRLFGKAGVEQISVLNEGGRALQESIDYYQRFGGVTKETARRADEFNDTMGKLVLVAGSFTRTLASDLLPALQAIADELLRSKEAGGAYQAVIDGIRIAFETVAVVGANVAFVFGGVGREIGAIAAQIAALGRGDFKGFTAIGDAVKEDGRVARAELDAFERRVLQVKGAVTQATTAADFQRGDKDTTRVRGKAPGLAASGSKEKEKSDFPGLLKQVTELNAAQQLLLDTEGELTRAQQLGAKVAADYAEGILKITPTQLAQIDAGLKKADALEREVIARDLVAKSMQDAANENAAFIEQQMALRDAALEQAKAAGIELEAFGKTREEVDALATARMRDASAALAQRAAAADAAGLEDVAKLYREQAGAILAAANAREQLAMREKRAQTDVLQGAQDALRDYLADNAKAGEQTYQLVRDSFKSLEDLGVQALSGGDWKAAAKSLVDQVLQEMYRLYVIKPLLNSIFGKSGTGGGDWLSLLAGLIGGFSTGNTGNTGSMGFGIPSGGEMATGTNRVPYDGFKATLHKDEAVVPAAYNPAVGKAGLKVIINAPPGTQVDRQEERDDGRELEVFLSRVERRIAGNVSSGRSPINSALRGRGVNTSAGLPKRA